MLLQLSVDTDGLTFFRVFVTINRSPKTLLRCRCRDPKKNSLAQLSQVSNTAHSRGACMQFLSNIRLKWHFHDLCCELNGIFILCANAAERSKRAKKSAWEMIADCTSPTPAIAKAGPTEFFSSPRGLWDWPLTPPRCLNAQDNLWISELRGGKRKKEGRKDGEGHLEERNKIWKGTFSVKERNKIRPAEREFFLTRKERKTESYF